MSQVDSTFGTAGSIRLRGGRSLTFLTAGPLDGFPIIYCHGAIGSPRWRVPGLEAALEQLSIRYIVVNRPGFGGSEPDPGRTVRDYADDVGELTNALGHERFSVLGVSAGAPYALACGWALADRVASLAAVSPLSPSSGPGASASLRYRIPMIPFGLPGLGPATAEMCLRALRLHRHTSTRAMIEDYRVCRGDWGFDPASLTIPVTVWHGRADHLVPLRHAMVLAHAIRDCTACVDPRGGHFFYSRRLAQIVTTLLPASATTAESTLPALRAA